MISHSLADTKNIAEGFAKDLVTRGRGRNAMLVGLYGDLGSGKTAFTQIAAKAFGVKEEVTSPTFIIEKIYKTGSDIFPSFVHVDAYRLDSGDDLKKLGFEKVLKNPETVVFLEWPERVVDILPDHIRVMCTFVSEKSREYEIIVPNEK
jgi:tRNA threonylcarbamoyladenosine biosynthesis protein TsaE